VIGFGGPVPVVATLAETMKWKPEAVLVGITPPGGRLPEDLKKTLLEAIDHGCDVYCGLHDFITEDEDLVAAAKAKQVRLWDIRKPPKHMPVGTGLARNSKSYISLMVGTDCAIGKMTVALEIQRHAQKQGIKAEFVATGQCGIAIAGWGSPIDAIPGDFMAGMVEKDCLQCEGADMILVEGQGSLYHPGFSSVTLALIHGSCPDSMILCCMLSRKQISNINNMPIPSLDKVADLYLTTARVVSPHCRIVGVSINSVGTSEQEVKDAIREYERLLGVPATDPVRFGPQKLIEALQTHRRLVGK
jgi:uncharacterized NAD-dependent epimerase/dehydratase family protein